MNRKDTRKWIMRGGLIAILPAIVSIAGAVVYEADKTYLGYTGAPVLNQAKLASGNAVAYVPWFDTDGWDGDLWAAPVSSSGNVDLTSPVWRAADVMASAETADSTYWDTGRFIVTTNATTGAAIPFRYTSLAKSQQDSLHSKEKVLFLDFVRGDRSQEGLKFARERDSILGDIIHSTPVYVGAPDRGYSFNDYLAYKTANQSRDGRIYVGANDGMLHAFDEDTGEETFAFLPRTLIPRLNYLDGAGGYSHRYYVDGPLTVADVYYTSAWHTVLVGTLGHGGAGVFALDVTSADAITAEGSGAGGAAGKVLWELNSSSAGFSNLGYTHGRVAVGRMANNVWAAVIPNGYASGSGKASLLIVNVKDGTLIKEIVVSDFSANGMSSPTLVDIDSDDIVDYAYAGDLNGNLWKFDLTSSSPASWGVAYGGDALFKVETGLSITTAPEVGLHPTEGVMVYVATGRLLSAADTLDATDNVVYGIWDKPWDATDTPLAYSSLTENMVTQSFTTVTHSGTGDSVRTLSNNTADWGSQIGWRVPLASTNEATQGWRALTPITLRSGRLHLMANSPVDQVGENWYLQFDAIDGGAPSEIIVDVDGDNSLDNDDLVDGNGDDSVANVAEDRVVGLRKGIGLASAPTFAPVSYSNDAVLFNHLAQHEQIYHPPGAAVGEDAGILAGHFDLDNSSQTYALSSGTTDQHTHEWDDKWDLTDVDLFDILGGHRSVDDSNGAPGNAKTTPFLINLANAHLSPAGVLEINGVGTPVEDYRAFLKRVYTNTLADGEQPPLYTLDAPSTAQYDAGVRQLTSLRLNFPDTAILTHGLLATATGCVRGNEMGIGGEYRNGALTVQLLDATNNLEEDYAYDATTETYYKPSGGSHRVHSLGYAVPYDLGTHRKGDGMMHEVTVFWHWGGACYSPDHEAEYIEDYEDIVGLPFVLNADEDIEANPAEDDEGSSGGGEGGPESDATEFHEVSTSVITFSDRTGRLFWREIVPND